MKNKQSAHINNKNKRKFIVKIHQAYREIVAVCDSELLGKKFEEGKMQLEVKKSFYEGEEVTREKLIKILKEKQDDDACFNFVGQNSINAAIEVGIIDPNSVIRIQKIPHAMALL